MNQNFLLARTVVEAPTGSVSATPTLRVQTISDYPSFRDLESVWNQLVEEAGIDHPFLTHEWVRTWWECFGAGKELHILVVKAGTEVTAIAPFMLTQGRMYGFPVRQVEFIANVLTERFDLVVGRRHDESYRAIWSHLVNEKARWDVLRLCQLPAGSRTLEELPRLAQEAGFRIGTWRSCDTLYIGFADGWDAFFKRLSSNQRHKLRRVLKRLEERGQVALEVISSGEQVAAALCDGFRIEAAAWKGQARTAINCQPELRRFFTQLAAGASRSGMLQLLFLKLADTRLAFAYALRYKNRLFTLKAGYDPQYAPYSPYNLLCNLVFRYACERGLDEYEFLGDNAEWKLLWTKQTKSHYWLYVFSTSRRARFLHWAKFRIVPRLHQLWLYLFARDCVARLRGWPAFRRSRSKPPRRHPQGPHRRGNHAEKGSVASSDSRHKTDR